MTALHDFALARGIQFASDEVYHPIYHGRQTVSAARLPNATIIGDFSKAFSLGGLRLGWAVERNVQLRKQYMNAREYMPGNTSTCAEKSGREILPGPSNTLRLLCKEVGLLLDLIAAQFCSP